MPDWLILGLVVLAILALVVAVALVAQSNRRRTNSVDDQSRQGPGDEDTIPLRIGEGPYTRNDDFFAPYPAPRQTDRNNATGFDHPTGVWDLKRGPYPGAHGHGGDHDTN